MAILKFGSIITEGSGSLGGHTIQHSKGGYQLRNKPHPRSGCSADQYSIRSLNPILQAGWQALTPAQRKIWNDWPVTHGIMNAKGDKHALSGHSLWMKYCFAYYQVTGSLMSNPWELGPPWYGPELFKNGSFDSSAYWLMTAPFTISGGKAHYNSYASGRIYQYFTILNETNYQLKFEISNAVDQAFVRFYDFYGDPLFYPPYDVYRLYSNGAYTLNVKTQLPSIAFRWNSTTGHGNYSLDLISLKQIF
jgi:hypothetical protein